MTNTRPVRTDYLQRGQVVKITKSGDPLRATANALMYLKGGKFEATVVEVYHEETGRLYAQLRLSPNGQVRTIFEAQPGEFVTRSTLCYFRQLRKEFAK